MNSKINKIYKTLTEIEFTITFSKFICFFCLITLILIFRRPDAFLFPQPYAEDGPIFIEQVIFSGFESIFAPYNGYYHLIPRMVAIISSFFGINYIPLIMNFSALLIAAFCISFIAHPRFTFLIPNTLIRLLTSILIACIPGREIFFNITNIQWFISLFLILYTCLFLFESNFFIKTHKSDYFVDIFATFGFLSSSFSLILIPSIIFGILIRYQSEKKFCSLSNSIKLIPLISCFIYGFCTLFANDIKGTLSFPVFENINWFSIQVVARIFNNELEILKYIDGSFLLISVLIPVLLSLYYLRKDFITLWLLSVMMLFILIINISRPSSILDFMNTYGGVFNRYLLIPWSILIIIFNRGICYNKKIIIQLLFVLMILFITINFVQNYQLKPYPNYDFQNSTVGFDIDGDYSYYIPINPPGWFFKIPTNVSFIEEQSKSGKLVKSGRNNVSEVYVVSSKIPDNNYVLIQNDTPLENIKLIRPSLTLKSTIMTEELFYNIDYLEDNDEFIFIRGWAFISNKSGSYNDTINFIITKNNSLISAYASNIISRPDVTSAYKYLNMNLDRSGFEVTFPKDEIPIGSYILFPSIPSEDYWYIPKYGYTFENIEK